MKKKPTGTGHPTLPGLELPQEMAKQGVSVVHVGEPKRGKPTQGWAQTDLKAHDQMWRLGLESPTALPLLHYMIAQMRRTATVYVASASTLAGELGVSERTIQSAVKALKQYDFVQILKSGNTNVYVVNSEVAWRGERGMRTALVPAMIHLTEREQDSPIETLQEEAKRLIPVPDMSMFHNATIDAEVNEKPDAPV